MSNAGFIQSKVNNTSNAARKLRRLLATIGLWAIDLWQQQVHFLSDAVAVLWQSRRRFTWRRPVRAEFMRQCYHVGTRALPFITVSGIFIGFGIVAQALLWLEVFGGTALFGGFLSVVLVREIAPVLVGLIVIGRSGSIIVVELGTMKAEGQVHMLDAQGIDPFLYLVLPRVLALSICMFCLTIAFVAVALMAGFVSGTLLGPTKFTFLDFIHRSLGSMGRQEYVSIAAKTLTIGFVVGLISCKAAVALNGSAADVLDILPRSFAKSVLATLVISIVLTILL
ncbi:MAG: ABC transporter permease [Desulfobacterales bacterium]|jgi:phospholipid/cholesterol/gamma-HCH transport system permease protein